jgi:hypothetical protein
MVQEYQAAPVSLCREHIVLRILLCEAADEPECTMTRPPDTSSPGFR